MKRYLLDTGPAQDVYNNRRGIRKRVKAEQSSGARIGICTPVLGELWAGVIGSNDQQRNAQLLKRWLPDVIIWPYTDAAAKEFGRFSILLRQTGRPMQQIDVQIAAIALTLRIADEITSVPNHIYRGLVRGSMR